MILAVIDATGDAGTRCDLTGRPRALTPIANLPLICHVLDDLAEAGLREAHIVCSLSLQGDFEAAVGDGRTWGMTLSCSGASDGRGQQAVLIELGRALAAGPVLMHPGDCLFPRQLAPILAGFREDEMDLMVLEPAGGRSQGAAGTAGGQRALETAVVLAPRTRATVDKLVETTSAAADIVDALRADGCRVAVRELHEHWRFSASTEALLRANRMLLDALSVPTAHGDFGTGNTVRGRVAVSPQARVANCVLHGPVVIDDDVVLEDSFIGPYTSIGRGAAVHGAEIDNSMLFAGAEVRFPGQRVEASIIGEGASVGRSFELPKGMHVRLSPGSRVTLS